MVKACFLFLLLSVSVANATPIVVLGDSISAAYGISVNKGWVQLLQNKIDARQLDYSIHNESISGETSAGGLSRIEDVLTNHKPGLLLLELGANDGLRGIPPLVMKKNLSAIIQAAKKANCQVLLLSMRIPTNYGKRFTQMFYNSYFELAEEHDIAVVPFILQDVALDKSLMQDDQAHPNAKAQGIITEHIWPYVLPFLEAK